MKNLHRKISTLGDEDILQIWVLVIYELEYGYFNAPADKKERIRNTIDSALSDFDLTKRFLWDTLSKHEIRTSKHRPL